MIKYHLGNGGLRGIWSGTQDDQISRVGVSLSGLNRILEYTGP